MSVRTSLTRLLLKLLLVATLVDVTLALSATTLTTATEAQIQQISSESVKVVKSSLRNFHNQSSAYQEKTLGEWFKTAKTTTTAATTKALAKDNETSPQTQKTFHQVRLRSKREQIESHAKAQPQILIDSHYSANHKISLPSVPIPAPPPFPGLTSLGAGNAFPNAFSAFAAAERGISSAANTNPRCGGILKTRYGIIQTPNFPHKFSTPIECVWIIDASELPGISPANNVSIVVYLTQLYVLGGLKFTEYMYYSDDYKVPAHRVFSLTEDDVTQVAWVQFNSQYLEIRFTMTSLDGTHLRALDRLLDVYGFNITYEVQDVVKSYQCNTLQCRFLGHCYAKQDFSSYYCSCFAGFSGIDCGHGPLCDDPLTNICQNGGTCKHIGDAAITCHCPTGFKGTKCEIPEISGITMGCTHNSTSSNCHRECDFSKAFEGLPMTKVSRNPARTGKTRYEVTIRLGANLTAFYRNSDPERRASDHLPSLLERHVSEKRLINEKI